MKRLAQLFSLGLMIALTCAGIEEITIPMCQGLGFTHTVFPNVQGHTSQEQVAELLAHLEPIAHSGVCSVDFKRFACSRFVPLCRYHDCTDILYNPCSSLCQSAQNSCEQYLNVLGYNWPRSFDCEEVRWTTSCVGAIENIPPPKPPGSREFGNEVGASKNSESGGPKNEQNIPESINGLPKTGFIGGFRAPELERVYRGQQNFGRQTFGGGRNFEPVRQPPPPPPPVIYNEPVQSTHENVVKSSATIEAETRNRNNKQAQIASAAQKFEILRSEVSNVFGEPVAVQGDKDIFGDPVSLQGGQGVADHSLNMQQALSLIARLRELLQEVEDIVRS